MIRRERRWMRAAALSAITMLAGCQTPTPIVATESTACTAFAPITYSVQDTDPTVRQIRGHNAAWGALCVGKGPLPSPKSH